MISEEAGKRIKRIKQEMGEGSQKEPTSSYKIHKSWDALSSMVTIVNNNVLYISKLLRE